jgi:APA family basic amino acid/polyamine antiporter
MTTHQQPEPQLVRAIGFWMLTAYGVGDILGAGIYALVGEIAAVAGSLSWLSFLLAGVVAGLTGLTYAELGSRFPYSGGEAYFVQQALKRPRLSFLTGWLVFCSGLVSLATIARAFAAYASHLVPNVPESLLVAFLVTVLSVIAFVGIRISSSANAVCTAIESTGLLIVAGAAFVWLAAGVEATALDTARVDTARSDTEFSDLTHVLQGAALAFFAFIGFEDIVNLAEEVRDPQRTVPRALLTSLVIAIAIYVAVVLSATQVVAPQTLATANAPLLSVVEISWPKFPLGVFSVIALFAVANTGLANFVTSSRLIFGMSRQNLLPHWFGHINSRTHTPDLAIAACSVIGVGLALFGSLGQLAGATSCLILLIFALMNLSLILIRCHGARTSGFQAPGVTPYVALLCCLALLCFVSTDAIVTASVITGLGILFGIRVKQSSGSTVDAPAENAAE